MPRFLNAKSQALLLFSLVTTLCAAQEICSNNIDDDLDGLIDSADPDCGDHDNDGVLNAFDNDRDNDGITDMAELGCDRVPYDMIVWSHNGIVETAPTLYQNQLIQSASNEAFGLGVQATHTSSVMFLNGVDGSNESDAMAQNDFVAYAFEPSAQSGALLLSAIEIGRIAVPGVVSAEHYGYSISVRYSIDGFANSAQLCAALFIDTLISTSYESINIPMLSDQLILEPGFNYEFRVYVFGHTGNGFVSMDDFTLLASECRAAVDQDLDGIKNWYDLDSDNDGIYDVIESGWNLPSSNGRLDGAVDQFGIPISISDGNGGALFTSADLDGDSIFNAMDLDSDDDGCFDAIEAGFLDQDFNGQVDSSVASVDGTHGYVISSQNVYSSPDDANSNGVADYLETTSATIQCPSDTVIYNVQSKCYATLPNEQAVVLNSCGVVSLISSQGSMNDTLVVGAHQRTVNYQDQQGTALSCSQSITVLDMESPLAVTQPVTADMEGSQTFILTSDKIDGGSSDNCEISHFEIVPHVFSAAGVYTVEMVVHDASGNTDTAQSMLTLTDTVQTIELSTKVFLEGCYDHQTQLMNTDLVHKGFLPLNDPYFELGFRIAPLREEMDRSLQFVSGPGAVVDWVLLQLRDPSDPSVVLSDRSALLLRDGRVVDTDGSSPVNFRIPDGDYFVAIRHRNHLAVMTPTALNFNSAASWDFTNDLFAAWGTKSMVPIVGRYAMWSGNITNDGFISYNGPGNDRDAILSELNGVATSIKQGYSSSDVNLDGFIRYAGAQNDREPILRNIGSWNTSNVRPEQLPQ